MKNPKIKIIFVAVQSLQLENSFGVIDHEKNVELDVTIGMHDNERGFFEFSDKKTGGNDWYAEGYLFFEGNRLVDYDGVFELPKFITDKLQEVGFNVDDIL